MMTDIFNPMHIDNAVERASKWVDAVAPVIRTIDDLEGHYSNMFGDEIGSYVNRDSRDIVNDALFSLRELVANTRDDFMQEEAPKCPSNDDDDDAWDALEAFIDELEDRVPSIVQAYKIVLGDK